jgi:hypothetical protein
MRLLVRKEMGYSDSEIGAMSADELLEKVIFITKIYPELMGAGGEGKEENKPKGKGLRALIEGEAELDANGSII